MAIRWIGAAGALGLIAVLIGAAFGLTGAFTDDATELRATVQQYDVEFAAWRATNVARENLEYLLAQELGAWSVELSAWAWAHITVIVESPVSEEQMSVETVLRLVEIIQRHDPQTYDGYSIIMRSDRRAARYTVRRGGTEIVMQAAVWQEDWIPLTPPIATLPATPEGDG